MPTPAEFSTAETVWLDRIAHDLRGPLSPVRSAVQLLRTGSVKDDQAPAMLDLIDRQLDELIGLIDDIADRISLDRGRFQYRLQQTDLRSVADGIAVKYRRRLAAQNVEVEIETPDEPVDVPCDQRRLNQLLGYLIRHIAESRQDASRLVIAAQSGPPRLQLRFGAGAQALTAILRCIEADTCGSDAPLATAVLQRIVALHGLTLHLRSDEAAGSHVELRFPDAA